jgi:hypothetical protein
LLEVSVVSILMSLLVLMMSSTWSGFGRSLSDSIIRCRVAQQASLAVAALTRELGGQCPDHLTGLQEAGNVVGRMITGGSELRLCFDSGAPNGHADWATPDYVFSYRVEDGQLIRETEATGVIHVLASNVESMELVELSDGIRITLTFVYRDYSSTLTIVTQDPS